MASNTDARGDVTALRERFEAAYRAQLGLLSELRGLERAVAAQRGRLEDSARELRRERAGYATAAREADEAGRETVARRALERQLGAEAALDRVETDAALVAARENALRAARGEQERLVEELRGRRSEVRRVLTPSAVEWQLRALEERATDSPARAVIAAERAHGQDQQVGRGAVDNTGPVSRAAVENELARLRDDDARALVAGVRYDNPPRTRAGHEHPGLR